jgi:hypothetical protein
MIAKNYRKYPEALKLQMHLHFGHSVVRRISDVTPNKRRTGQMQYVEKAQEAEEIPIGALVRTPLGKLARVLKYSGYRRAHRIWLVCRYLEPENKRFDIVKILPERVVVVVENEEQRA